MCCRSGSVEVNVAVCLQVELVAIQEPAEFTKENFRSVEVLPGSNKDRWHRMTIGVGEA
jgi:hypothetical protein